MSEPSKRALSGPIAPFERSQRRILCSSITERKRKVDWAGPITARIRGSERNAAVLLRTGETACSRKVAVQVSNSAWKNFLTVGFCTLRRITARYAWSVRNRGRFQSEVGDGC